MNRYPRADRGFVALCPHKVEQHAVIRTVVSVEQKRRRLANIQHYDIHIAVVGDIAESRATPGFQWHLGQTGWL